MKKWIRNQKFMFSLLMGSLAIIIAIGLFWHGAMLSFLHTSDQANDIRSKADHLDILFLEARRAEMNFLLSDLASPRFHDQGESIHLSKHADLMSAISEEIEVFIDLTRGKEKELAEQIEGLIRKYHSEFLNLVAAYREKGHKDWGIEGKWRESIHEVETRLRAANNKSLEVLLLQLRRDEKDYLLRGEGKYIEAVHADLENLRVAIQAADLEDPEALLGHLQNYGQSFEEYQRIVDKIGGVQEGGLRGEIAKVVRTVDPLLIEISAQAEVERQQSRDHMVVAGVGISIAGLVVAGLFFYFFARAIAQPLVKLSEVAGLVGGGDLKVRMDYEANNELGGLARGFNLMVEALVKLVGHVQRSCIQVNTSVNEIAATAKQQQTTANEVAATTTEIGATAKEITATSKELVQTVHEVSTVAEETATLADNGRSGVSQMEETMKHVMEAGASINAKLAVLNEKAGNINQVVTTITKVADQTNLLSLNAAIEAEKAGEHGRGFAVVATEIRRLADQTAVATDDIEQMVKDMLSAVSAGVMGMDKFSEEVRRGVDEVHEVGAQLTQIIEQVQTLTPRFDVVNEGMEAQSTGAVQISDALAQLSDAAQQTAESLRQSNDAIAQLNEASQSMKSGVEQFKL